MWLQHGAHSQGFAFLKVPHGFHKHSLGSRCSIYLFILTAILLPRTTAHIYLCTFTHPQTFPWFYCRMFTGERLALDPRSGHFRVEPCNYQPIAPAAAFFFALTVFCFFKHRASFTCGLGGLSAVAGWCCNYSPLQFVMLSGK